MRKETEQSLAKLQAQAQAEIASATKAARQELKAYSAELALKLAERKIEQQMNPELQKQLTDGFVSDLKRKAGLN